MDVNTQGMRFSAPWVISHSDQYIPTPFPCKTVLTSRDLDPTIPYVMFRPRLSFALALIASVLLFSGVAVAQVPLGHDSIAEYQHALVSMPQDGIISMAKSLVAEDISGPVRKIVLAGASDVVAGYATGTTAPYVAIIATRAMDRGSHWSEAAWLAILDRYTISVTRADAVAAPGTVYMLLVDDEAPDAVPAPGDPLFRNLRIRSALADLGVEAVLILNFDAPPVELTLHAASWKKVAPRRVLGAARSASQNTGITVSEVPVLDFYAASGLSSGYATLAGWLEAGVPALVLDSSAASTQASGAVLVDVVDFSMEFARSALVEYSRASQGTSVSGDDTDYLRYPTPFGSLLLGDATIVAATLISLTALTYALALGWLKGKRRTASFKAVSSEVFASFGFSLIALLLSRGLSDVMFALAGTMLSPETLFTRDSSSLSVALALGIRILGTLSVYYAVSGLASKAGLLVDHRRIDAARAALVLFFFDAIVALVLFPPVVPFLLVAMALVLFSSVTAASAALGLVVTGVIALPFFDPRVVAAIGTASGGSGSVASAMLDAGLRGLVATAAFAAPFGLWVNIATSPASRIRRGHRTALFWVLSALLCSLAEVAVRLVSITS